MRATVIHPSAATKTPLRYFPVSGLFADTSITTIRNGAAATPLTVGGVVSNQAADYSRYAEAQVSERAYILLGTTAR